MTDTGPIPGTRPFYGELPHIPAIPVDLVMPIQCLVYTACHFRKAVREAVELMHGLDVPPELAESLAGYDAILDTWVDHPALDIEPID